MKISINIFGLILMATALLSCGDGNYKNVIISGDLKEKNNSTIDNAKVTVKCWAYSTEVWESQSTEKTVFTDSNGTFEVTFEKGEAIDIQIEADGFKPVERSFTLDRSNLKLDFLLERE